MEEYIAQQLQQDKAHKLLAKDGFHFKSHGRSGALYYVNNSRLAYADCELTSVGMDVYMPSLACWYLPVVQKMTDEERTQAVDAFRVWNNKKFKFNRLKEFWP